MAVAPLAEVPGIGLVGADGVGWVAFRTAAAIALPADAAGARLALLDGAERVAATPVEPATPIGSPVEGGPAGSLVVAGPGPPLAPPLDAAPLDLLAPPAAAVVEAPVGLRCAWCHDDLPGPCVACPVCATRLHPECVVERRCPTLGCRHPFLPGVGPARAPRARRSPARGLPWLRLLGGAVVPFVCFGANEALNPLRHLAGGLYSPSVQRLLYPVLLWTIVALVAAAAGRRAPWIRGGLLAGVVLSGLFSALYVPLLPAAVVGLLFGIGLLGFGPYVTFAAFLAARRAYARGDEQARAGALAARIVVVPKVRA